MLSWLGYSVHYTFQHCLRMQTPKSSAGSGWATQYTFCSGMYIPQQVGLQLDHIQSQYPQLVH
jgi:hypothetical protein